MELLGVAVLVLTLVGFCQGGVLTQPEEQEQGDVPVSLTCDVKENGEWNPQCDLLDSGVFYEGGNGTARFERAVEVLPGLRLPSLGDCSKDNILSRLVARVLRTYFPGCTPVLRYDRFLESSCGVQRLLSGALPEGLTHGRLAGGTGIFQSPVPRDGPCTATVFMLQHIEDARTISRVGTSHGGTVLLVTASPLWRVEEFLLKWEQRPIRVLIIASAHWARPVISTQHLTPWFPSKINIAMRHEPPYSIHRPNDTTSSEWTGIEPLMLDILSKKLNFTYKIHVVPELMGGDAVRDMILSGASDIGMGGLYMKDDNEQVAAVKPYVQDCAVFMTRASTALPRHRAILGPFQLAVWLTLTTAYMILMLAVAAPRNKKKAVGAQSRLDSFWLVFGTFTNAMIIKSRTWSDRMSVRILLSFYWVFTVIITAAYTSSIIAFVTLPVFPATIDSAEEILATPKFRWGTLGSSGWDKMLRDSDDAVSRHMQAGFEFLPRVEHGIRNVSLSATYAFLGARKRLQYDSSDDLSGVLTGKKALHLGSQCFLPLLPSIIATPSLRPALDPFTLTMIQSGIIVKALKDVEWQEQRRRIRNTATGGIRLEFTRKMPHERRLGMEDVVGTFILLTAGYSLGLVSFGLERMVRWMRLYDVVNRFNSAMATVKRRVSNRVGSESNSSSGSRQSLRLRSGRLWSRTSRGSRLGSMLDVVPERRSSKRAEKDSPESPASQDSLRTTHGSRDEEKDNGVVETDGDSTAWAASAPTLKELEDPVEDEDLTAVTSDLKRPKSAEDP